jgi:hypothetical protein
MHLSGELLPQRCLTRAGAEIEGCSFRLMVGWRPLPCWAVNGDGEDTPPRDKTTTADELADRLLERRERLAYFLITGGTAIIAFTVTQLNQTNGALREGPVIWLAIGWLGLLLSAGCSLMLIWKRHRSYALYIDSLYGRDLTEQERDKARQSVEWWQKAALTTFFLGSVIEVAAWACAIWKASG